MARPARGGQIQCLGQGNEPDTQMLQFLEGGQQICYVSGAQILCNDMNPTIGLRGTFPVTESSELPSMLHSVPEVEDLATPHFRPIPTITTTV